ncbi:MAG: UDP-N-acetylmuramate dehydrogenase [Patescibacteria group bacterium]
MEDNIKIQKNILLKKYSTFGIGGNAELFFLAKKPEDVVSAALWAKGKKFSMKIFAGGSNIFFERNNFKELLVCVRGGKIVRDRNKYIVDSGVLLDSVVKKSLRDGYSGLESLTAIPGTIGGAVYGNAGAYGHSISEVVHMVQIFDGKKIFWMSRNMCKFGYRESLFKRKNLIILRVKIILKRNKKNTARDVSKNIRLIRNKKYPPTLKCPGSFFKNVLAKNISKNTIKKIDTSKIIEGKIPAGYLLESIGAKGMCVGGIKVADYHGNLFINIGNATAEDVNNITTLLKKMVKTRFKINLEEEIIRF